ncbi:MAG: ubiquitin-like small modifier protein 1 [Thermoplasmataceae archaeon]
MTKVKYYANLRQITGKNDDEMDAGGKTVEEILQVLSSKYGDNFKRLMFSDGNMRGNVIILVNGQNIIFRNGIKERLRSDDLLDIFPPVAGG